MSVQGAWGCREHRQPHSMGTEGSGELLGADPAPGGRTQRSNIPRRGHGGRECEGDKFNPRQGRDEAGFKAGERKLRQEPKFGAVGEGGGRLGRREKGEGWEEN